MFLIITYNYIYIYIYVCVYNGIYHYRHIHISYFMKSNITYESIKIVSQLCENDMESFILNIYDKKNIS